MQILVTRSLELTSSLGLSIPLFALEVLKARINYLAHCLTRDRR
jgi:hypothetical protein